MGSLGICRFSIEWYDYFCFHILWCGRTLYYIYPGKICNVNTYILAMDWILVYILCCCRIITCDASYASIISCRYASSSMWTILVYFVVWFASFDILCRLTDAPECLYLIAFTWFCVFMRVKTCWQPVREYNLFNSSSMIFYKRIQDSPDRGVLNSFI